MFQVSLSHGPVGADPWHNKQDWKMAILKYQVEVINRRRDEDHPDGRVLAYAWQYEEVTNPHREGKILTREEAIEAIKEQGLVLVHQMGGCRIYDHPDEPMWQKYHK